MTEKQKTAFKAAFTTAITALEWADGISKICGGKGLDDKSKRMLDAHRSVLAELQKERPSIDVIHNILLSTYPDRIKPIQFPPGGIVSEADGGEYIAKKTKP